MRASGRALCDANPMCALDDVSKVSVFSEDILSEQSAVRVMPSTFVSYFGILEIQQTLTSCVPYYSPAPSTSPAIVPREFGVYLQDVGHKSQYRSCLRARSCRF